MCRCQEGGFYKAAFLVKHHQGGSLLDASGYIPEGTGVRRGIHPEADAVYLGGHYAVIELEYGNVKFNLAVVAGGYKRQMSGDSQLPYHGYQKYRLILAVAVFVLEYLRRLVRLIPRCSVFQTHVAYFRSHVVEKDFYLIGGRGGGGG